MGEELKSELNEHRKRLLRVKSVSLALRCKLPVYRSEPTCSGTAPTVAMGQEETFLSCCPSCDLSQSRARVPFDAPAVV
jgi:hypothetical protein